MNIFDRSKLKIKHPCRTQIEMNYFSLDERLPHDHKARAVWDFVRQMDTSILFEKVKSHKGAAGQQATSPEVLLALWIYGITEGTYSARKISRECQENDAYRWIAGNTGVNRENLASFRSMAPETFQNLLTESLSVMLKNKLLYEEDFAQDGTRIKAAAGFNTFRKEKSIESIKAKMESLINEIKEKEQRFLHQEEKEKLKRQKRFAEERLHRAKKAVEELQKHKANLEENAKKNRDTNRLEKRLEKARTSFVDPECRKMKMGDGGFRLAFNTQFATGVQSRAIYGVSVGNTLDPGTMPKLISQVINRLRNLNLSLPKFWICDAAYSNKEDQEEVFRLFPKITVIAPPNISLEEAKKPKKKDSLVISRWRKLIGTETYKEIYNQRCSTSEFSNMVTKNRGLGNLLVRGARKALSSCLLYAIAHNAMRTWDLMAL